MKSHASWTIILISVFLSFFAIGSQVPNSLELADARACAAELNYQANWVGESDRIEYRREFNRWARSIGAELFTVRGKTFPFRGLVSAAREVLGLSRIESAQEFTMAVMPKGGLPALSQDLLPNGIQLGFATGWPQPGIGQIHAWLSIRDQLMHRDQNGIHTESYAQRMDWVLGRGKPSAVFSTFYLMTPSALDELNGFYTHLGANPKLLAPFCVTGSGHRKEKPGNCLTHATLFLRGDVHAAYPEFDLETARELVGIDDISWRPGQTEMSVSDMSGYYAGPVSKNRIGMLVFYNPAGETAASGAELAKKLAIQYAVSSGVAQAHGIARRRLDEVIQVERLTDF